MRNFYEFRRRRQGFSLLELMVSISILLVVMVVLLQITGAIGEIWKSTSGKISAFQNARSAFATITNTLSRATLNTYNDYVDSSGFYRSGLTETTSPKLSAFTPFKFARASELHFISGPTADIILGATTDLNPGHVILFQAPMGVTDDNNTYGKLNRTLNSIGMYVQYAPLEPSILPDWLKTPLAKQHRFRLVQVIEPTEKLQVYKSTAALNYDKDWIDTPFKIQTPLTSNQPRPRVLAEDVCLLLFRPRMAQQDELEVVKPATASLPNNLDLTTFNANSDVGSVLCPNYQYDSRAWETGYPSSGRVKSGGYTPAYSATQVGKVVEMMRNQVPPFVDVIMVSVDRRSLSRFDFTLDTPPAVFSPGNLFKDSKKLEADLATYSTQLANARIRFKVFRTSVEILGAKWSN